MSASAEWDAIVIGAGHNGLVASMYLAMAGLKVLVVEAKGKVGGACVTEAVFPGFLHEPCAQILHGLQPKIVRDSRLVERGLRTVDVSIRAHVYKDGRHLITTADTENNIREIAQFSENDAKNYRKWLKFSSRASRIFEPYLMRPPVSLARVFEDLRGKEDANLLAQLATRSIGQILGDYFESDEVMAVMWSPMDLGSYWEMGSGLGFALSQAISLREQEGPSRPRGTVIGGMGEVTRLLALAAAEAGAEIRVNSPVRQILLGGSKAAGVELESGDQIAARIVISNADPSRTFLKLVGEKALEPSFLKRLRNLRANYGSMKFLCTLSELPEFYATNHLDPKLIGSGWVKVRPTLEYHDLAWEDAMNGRLPRAPLLALQHHSVLDSSRAPEGKHTGSWYIEYAPYHLVEGTWDKRREEMAERLIDMIDQYSPNYRRALIDYKLITPWDLEKDRLLTASHIHHVDLIPGQLLDSRPLPELSQYRTPIKNLYLCGAGMHPWGEVNGAPGHNAAQQVLNDLNRARP